MNEDAYSFTEDLQKKYSIDFSAKIKPDEATRQLYIEWMDRHYKQLMEQSIKRAYENPFYDDNGFFKMREPIKKRKKKIG